MTDIREILRRVQLGEPDRRIARDLGVGRNTVGRYRAWAREHGVLDGGRIPEAALLAGLLAPAPVERPEHERSLVGPFRERVLALHERGVEGQAIWQLLVEQHGFVDLDPIRLDITAERGPGNLLGNLLCAIVGIFDPTNPLANLNQIINSLNRLLSLLERLT